IAARRVRALRGLARRGLSPRPLGPSSLLVGSVESSRPEPVPPPPELLAVGRASAARLSAPAPRGPGQVAPRRWPGHCRRGAAHGFRGPEPFHPRLPAVGRRHPGPVPAVSGSAVFEAAPDSGATRGARGTLVGCAPLRLLHVPRTLLLAALLLGDE